MNAMSTECVFRAIEKICLSICCENSKQRTIFWQYDFSILDVAAVDRIEMYSMHFMHFVGKPFESLHWMLTVQLMEFRNVLGTFETFETLEGVTLV